MKTFLIIAERPKHTDEAGATQAWQQFLSGTKPFLPPPRKGDEHLEGVWQIPLDTTMRTLAQLLPVAKEHHIVLRGLLLEEPPAWMKYP